MRREEYIYVQTGVCVRNRDQINVNTSSDLCFSDDTSFVVSGATKVVTDIKTCDFSDIPFNDIYTGGTECLITSGVAEGCIESIDWFIIVNENGVDVSREIFYTSEIAGAVPTGAVFISSVSDAFLSNQYTFTQSGTTFNVVKPFGVTDLRIDICTEITIRESGTGCPTGYEVTPDGTQCFSAVTVNATVNTGGTVTVDPITQASEFGQEGALFYEEITDKPYPIVKGTGNTLKDDSGTTVTQLENVKNSLWGNSTAVKDGRLNAIGVWGNVTYNGFASEWVGFSKCIEIEEGGKYSLALAADNYCRLKINGELIFNLVSSTQFTFFYWHVLTIELRAGVNIIEMEGKDTGPLYAGFGAEIYDAPVETLSGMTSELELGEVTIFSTGDFIGEEFELGEDTGYSCAPGYALDTCLGGTPVCTKKIFAEAETCEYTGSCESECYTACTETFDSIASGDTGVYIIEDEITIDFTFNLTGDTSSLSESHNFKYEVYKYSNPSKIWNQPAVYKSPEIPYSSVSGNSVNDFIQQIPVDSLQLDGDYLIKGFFKYDACTEFASRLGLSVDTSAYSNGQYVDSLDWYFIAIREAEVPTLGIAGQVSPTIETLFSYSLFPSFDGQTEYVMTVVPDSEPIVALNGLTLGISEDYTVSGNTILLSGETFSGDVITVIGANGIDSVSPIKVDTYLVETVVVSGVTDNQGSAEVYYNTDTNKYEVYTSVNMSDSDVIVSLNGITLANNIDYYQSVSNPRRIILEGDILVNDILTLYYTPSTDVSGQLISNPFNITWNVPSSPNSTDGKFIVEVTNGLDTGFTNIEQSIEVPYVATDVSYTAQITLSGSFGDEYLYRVKNVKEYVSLNGDVIVSENFSEVVSIFISSNNINSY